MTTRTRAEEPAVEIPHDVVNEQIILAAAISDAALRTELTSRIRSDSFYGPGHGALWDAVCALQKAGLQPSAHTLQQLSAGKVNADYVAQLMAAHPTTPANVAHHLDALGWDNTRVDAVRGPISQLIRSLQDPSTLPDRVKALARQVAASFDGVGDKRYLRDPATLVQEQTAVLASRRTGQAVYPFNIPGFDFEPDGTARLVPGAAPGKITVVTGVPGSGKSTFVCRVILGQARLKKRVLVGAWEMGDGTTLELLACMSLDFDRTKLMTGDFTEEEQAQIVARMTRISDYVRFVQMPFGKILGERHTNERNLDAIHGYIAASGCDFAVFDLWKRCLRDTKPDDEEQALIRQQAIAEETKCHVLMVQQQRLKDIELRPDKRPTREGIKGSGAWTEVADNIFGVHRPALWKRVDDSVIEVDALKQRYGRWPLAVEFDWDAKRGSFENARAVEYDPPGAPKTNDVDSWIDNSPRGRRRKAK